MGKVSGQFQNQEYRCNGGTHAGGNKGGHGGRDDICTVHGINDAQGNKDIGLNGPHQGTDREHRHQEPARDTASCRQYGKQVLSCKQDKEHGQRGVFVYDRIDQAIAAFRDLRKSQTDKGPQDKGEKQAGKYAFQMDGVIEAAYMGKAVIIKDAQRSADGSCQNQWENQQMGGGRHMWEDENAFLSEYISGHYSGRYGRSHGGKKKSRGETLIHFFQCEYRAGQGGTECGSQPGTGTTGDKIFFFQRYAFKYPADTLGHGRPNLY